MTRATMSRHSSSVAPYHKHDAEENDQPDAKGPEKRHHRIGELRENEWRRGQAEGKHEELVPHPVPEEPEQL